MHFIMGNRDAYNILSNHTQIDFVSSVIIEHHIAYVRAISEIKNGTCRLPYFLTLFAFPLMTAYLKNIFQPVRHIHVYKKKLLQPPLPNLNLCPKEQYSSIAQLYMYVYLPLNFQIKSSNSTQEQKIKICKHY